VPIGVADVWKTTPFVAILLLAGLQTIDPALYEAASMDGAGSGRRFRTITMPLLAPTLVVAAAFRTLDALRLFDVVYVITAGGPGTATEPLSLYAFIALMQRLRFGYGSALSVIVFLLTFGFALVWVRALGRSLVGDRA
jgi:ABC-type sugar transport system permease subunit